MAKPIPSRLADNYQTYPTPDAAAVAALRGIDNTEYERGGGILFNKEQNVYAATEPVGQNDGSHLAAAVGVPKGWKLHSTYHTHPAGPLSTQFSDNDVDTAQQLKAPCYVLARDDDKVRVFDPASSKVSYDVHPGHFGGGRFSNGSLVDETPPAPAPAQPPAAAAPSVAAPSPPTAPTAADAPAPVTPVPVTASRVTMKDFAARHRVTKYKRQAVHKVVHIK